MMTNTLDAMDSASSKSPGKSDETTSAQELSADELAVVDGLVRQAKDQGVALTGPNGPLKALTKP